MKTLLLVAVAGVLLTMTVQVESSRAVEAAKQPPAAAQAKAGSKCDKQVISTTYAACYAYNVKMGWKGSAASDFATNIARSDLPLREIPL